MTGAATCLGCGCACDDIDLHVRDNRIIEARNACSLGVGWFGDGTVPGRVRVSGHHAALEEAIDAAARLLAQASRAIVYLAPDLSCEAQREGVAVADALRATLDSVTSATVMGSILAAQERGRASATLGEIRHRADVIVFWGVDPALTYPRYQARYAANAPGIHVPNGRRSRTIIAVDVGDARGPADADQRFLVSAADEVAMLTMLRAEVEPQDAGVRRGHESSTGSGPGTAPLAGVAECSAALLAGRYVAIVADAEAGAVRDSGRAAALIALAQSLNGPTRAALSLLRAGGNRSGADACTTWQTGYPAAVDFTRGFPRYRPHDGSAGARLDRGEVDAALVLGSAAGIPPSVLSALASIPTAVVGPRASESPLAGGVAVIDTAVAGIHEAGTALRMDDVPLPLRAAVSGPPSALDVIRALRARLPSVRR
jgi:formylmethanofuran dehydrogenase subunit B